MKGASSVIAVVALACACSDKGDEVAALVAAGSILTVVQMAQDRGAPATGPGDEDCLFPCGPCEVPCGDHCLPFGTLCYEAPRQACYGGSPDTPRRPSRTSCPDPGALDLVLPLGF